MVKSDKMVVKVGEELFQSAEMLSIIFELNSDIIILSRASDGKFIYCNQKFLDHIGYSRGEVIGRTTTEINLYSFEERQVYVEEIQRKKIVSDFEMKLRRKDGVFIYILYSARFINFDGEQLILTVGKDITKRKNAEEKLKQSEARFRSVFENSMDVIYRFNIQTGRYEYMSPAIRTLNFEPEELIEMSNEEVLSWVHPDDLPDLLSELSRLNQAGKGISEYRFQGKDGNYRWWSNQMVISRDQEGQPLYRDGFVRDVTELKLSEEKLKNTLAELKRSNQELEQFAYVASHDLQEPLRMVTSFSQLLEQRYKDRLDDDAHEFIGFMVEGSQRMKYLIDDLLTFSRVTSQAREFESVDLQGVLDVVISNLSVSIKENNAVITHEPLPTVFADPSQMIQVFQNVIANALKFQGQHTPKIHISTQKGEKEWKFSIKDNGIGINPQHQEQIFEVFRRLHTRQEYPGTGIGLAICQKIIERHGGHIWAESEPGKGSTFYFTIPAH